MTIGPLGCLFPIFNAVNNTAMKILLYMSPGAPIKRFLYKFSNEITGPWVSVLHSKIGLEFRFLPAETGTHLPPHQSLSL